MHACRIANHLWGFLWCFFILKNACLFFSLCMHRPKIIATGVPMQSWCLLLSSSFCFFRLDSSSLSASMWEKLSHRYRNIPVLSLVFMVFLYFKERWFVLCSLMHACIRTAFSFLQSITFYNNHPTHIFYPCTLYRFLSEYYYGNIQNHISRFHSSLFASFPCKYDYLYAKRTDYISWVLWSGLLAGMSMLTG